MFVILCFLPLSASSGLFFEQHHYLKKTGAAFIHFDWRLEHGEDLKLVTVLGKERDVTRMNNDFSTQSWVIEDPSTTTNMTVLRNNNELIMDGIFKGEKVERTIKVDSSPWYQALSLSLRQFVDQNRNHIQFWSIRPDNLDVHRLQVNREAEETRIIEGTLTEVIKLKIQLTGLKSVFWSCYYWLRKSDGLFVRYEGPSGPPGWPLTTVELLEAPTQAELAEIIQQAQ